LLFSAVISEHFSKKRMLISVVAAKTWYLKNVRFLLGHPLIMNSYPKVSCCTWTLPTPSGGCVWFLLTRSKHSLADLGTKYNSLMPL